MIVIGITGLARSGKDTVADILISKYGFYKIGMADPIYKIARDFYGWDGQKDEKGRKLLQEIGTIGRNYNVDVWVNYVKQHIKELCSRVRWFSQTKGNVRIVVCGVRYPNEVDMIRGYNVNYLWKVTGRGGLQGDVAKHSSEQHISEFKTDHIIDNSVSFGQLEGDVISLFRQIQVANQTQI